MLIAVLHAAVPGNPGRPVLAGQGACAIMDLATGTLELVSDSGLLFARGYPIGSVAKLLVTLAWAEQDTAPSGYTCRGEDTVAGLRLVCSVRSGHGPVDQEQAFAQSCNLYFARLAAALPPGALESVFERLRLDRPVGLDLPGEVPSRFGPFKSAAARVAAGLGQGPDVQFTAAALLFLISGVARPGCFVRPKLDAARMPERVACDVSPSALGNLRPMLVRACRTGTGAAPGVEFPTLAGKTGTAGECDTWRTHGWFIGYTTDPGPERAVVVFLKRGDGRRAVALARQILEGLRVN